MKTLPRITGRKFDIARLAMWQGFAITGGAIVAVVLAKPESGTHIAGIVGSFAGILMVGVGAFNVANAAVTWKHGAPQTKIEQTSSTIVTGAPTEPPTEQSE